MAGRNPTMRPDNRVCWHTGETPVNGRFRPLRSPDPGTEQVSRMAKIHNTGAPAPQIKIVLVHRMPTSWSFLVAVSSILTAWAAIASCIGHPNYIVNVIALIGSFTVLAWYRRSWNRTRRIAAGRRVQRNSTCP